jgi:hypothetical protein
VTFAGGCQQLGGLGTEAAERNNVAKTTILYVCSTELTEGDVRSPFTVTAGANAGIALPTIT